MKFSLIIPVAPERNAEIIESIKKLNYPKNEFHVIVIRGKNPSINRNKGAEKAIGEFIVFLDDDAVLDEDYLINVEEFFKRHPEIDIVGGPQLTPEDDRGFAKISGYALSSKFGAWKLASRYSSHKEEYDADETSITSANLVCKRKVIEKIKFDSDLFPGEDPKFISDAKKLGFKIGYSPYFILYHRRRANIKGLIKQIFNYGKVRPVKEKFFETLKNPFFLVPSAFFIYLVLLIISIIINPQITGAIIGTDERFSLNFLWFLPLIAYIVLIILFGIGDSIKNKDYKAIFILPLIYPLIHLSYGYGMIYGYLKKLG